MDDEKRRDDDVAAFVRGDPVGVASIEAAVRATVRGFRFGNPDVDRDLVQETLSRTLTSLSDRRFLGEASLKTYASNVARYTCLEHIRRRRNDVVFDPELHSVGDLASAPEASYLSTEEHRRNIEAFASLPADCREILCMICLEGASYREVASRLGVSEAALKSRIHRCRLTCREAAKPSVRPKRLVLGKASP